MSSGMSLRFNLMGEELVESHRKRRQFFKADRYLVLGEFATATGQQPTWATKILRWYIEHGLDVTPVTPQKELVEVEGRKVIRSINHLPLEDWGRISVSVVTKARDTLLTLQQASFQQANLTDYDAFLWLQPGAGGEDHDCVDFIRKDSELKAYVIFRGECVLIDGGEALEAAGKEKEKGDSI
ncbi:hypothetical protein CONPUDRAFT_164447 [Coniophora puteana RWD-64-598 SS2]|uniref:CoA-binding domain-containing protein n=1 Tax=Coniophora puteana (strain RWD-64-598) TaxID=741705 RepID=A0A5M3MWS6_CONPW|nr:uncharacterized protein CONPUDRAFT_164447 [Coniophora puteana RWD-64-598 SS2]EIW83520.1 hypothetical protein CONPUDRAFT_164447 [Coniophora puteana RWD-64-598 SS2]